MARGARTNGPRRAFRFTLYSTLCVVSRAPRVRRERWLQVLDGMRRQRGIRTCSDKASQATSISSRGLWGCRGGNEQIARGSSHRESGLSSCAASKSSRRPRFERRRLRGAAVAPPSPSMKAAAVVSPPTLRPAGGTLCASRPLCAPFNGRSSRPSRLRRARRGWQEDVSQSRRMTAGVGRNHAWSRADAGRLSGQRMVKRK